MLALLRKLSKTFGTHDIIEEFVACDCFPVRAGWTISSWLAEDRWIEGIPVPDFVAAFNLRAERKFIVPLFFTLANTSAPLLLLTLCASLAMKVWTQLSLKVGPTRWSDRSPQPSTKPWRDTSVEFDRTGCSTPSASRRLGVRLR